MTGNESLSALRSGMNSLRLRMFGVWLLAVGGGAAKAALTMMMATMTLAADAAVASFSSIERLLFVF